MAPKKPKIIPRGPYMLIKPIGDEPRENENGLIVPPKIEQEQRAQGTVEAVSSEIKDVKIGDTVIYGAYAGEELRLRENGKEVLYKLLHNDDVIAFVK